MTSSAIKMPRRNLDFGADYFFPFVAVVVVVGVVVVVVPVIVVIDVVVAVVVVAAVVVVVDVVVDKPFSPH